MQFVLIFSFGGEAIRHPATSPLGMLDGIDVNTLWHGQNGKEAEAGTEIDAKVRDYTVRYCWISFLCHHVASHKQVPLHFRWGMRAVS